MKEVDVMITWFLLLQLYPHLHAVPPIEPCPHDSVQVEDTCKCDPNLCTKPPCQYTLSIAVNGTDIPGNCCTIYSCNGCSNDTLINDKCPCAPGAVLDAKGECKCIDPHTILKNNECVCDPDLCELPQICGKNYVSVIEDDGCCSTNKCIKCPDDSFATNNNDEAIEDKCLCFPCKDKECGHNEKIVIIQNGNGYPGTCCDMYKCEKDGASMRCDVEGTVYEDGDVWNTSEGERCDCRGGIWFCNKQDENSDSCHKEGSVYKHNESWMLDNCTNCTCVKGEIKCISHMCEVSQVHIKKPECQVLNCSKACPDGYKLNKRGCMTCKCNYSYKYDDILQKYNLTKNQLKDILDEYFKGTKNESNSFTVTVTNGPDQHDVTATHSETDGCHTLDAVKWSVVGFSIGIILIIAIRAMRWLTQRKRGSYDTNPARSTIYERMNLTKGTLFNNNYLGNENKDEHKIKGNV